MLDKFINRVKSGISLKKSYAALAAVLVFLCFAAYIYFNKYFYLFNNPNKLKMVITGYGRYSVFVFLGFQIIQVVVFFIPGEIVQIAGGYIFGTFYGSVLSILGITIGSSIIYGISNLFGRPLVKRIISRRHLELFEKILKLGSVNYVVFLLYLIPGIPKDVLGYICGISEMSFRNFIWYSTLGRIPAIVISAYFGAGIIGGKTGNLVFIAIISTALFVFGVFKGEKIISLLVKKD
ncbi:MAG: TVP38/TMEM64 family protein [Solirubrobacterales bacterium]